MEKTLGGLMKINRLQTIPISSQAVYLHNQVRMNYKNTI